MLANPWACVRDPARPLRCAIFASMRTKLLLISFLCLFTLLTAAQQGEPLPDEKNTVAEAQKQLAAEPKNVKLIIDLGKAQAALWRANDAIATFTTGLKLEPENITMLLERGHRYVTTRQWDLAMKDLD